MIALTFAIEQQSIFARDHFALLRCGIVELFLNSTYRMLFWTCWNTIYMYKKYCRTFGCFCISLALSMLLLLDCFYVVAVRNLPEVLGQLCHFAKWRQLGKNLGLGPIVLKPIEADTRSASECLASVMEQCLRRNYRLDKHGLPTWSKLASAIQPIERELATCIMSRHSKKCTHHKVYYIQGYLIRKVLTLNDFYRFFLHVDKRLTNGPD